MFDKVICATVDSLIITQYHIFIICAMVKSHRYELEQVDR